MNETDRLGMSTAELFGATWRVWRSHAGTFVLLMAIPIATLLFFSLIVVYIIAPHPESTPLREVWLGMGSLQKMAVFVVFLASFAMQYRTLAASVFATQEFQAGRSVGIWQAIGTVRRKQLRLFWLVMLASLFTGPLGLIVFPILSFAVAPGFPVAILENKPAFAAIKRGDTLATGRHGLIALLVLLWLGLGVAAVFAWISFLVMLQDRFGQPLPWSLRPVPILGFWFILLIPQLYMIALTVNYLDQREQERQIASASGAPADVRLENPTSGG